MDVAERKISGLDGEEGDFKDILVVSEKCSVIIDHPFVDLVVGEGGESSSSLYSFLRSSENRFFLRVLAGDRPLVGGTWDNGLPLGGRGRFTRSRGSWGFVADMGFVKEEIERGGCMVVSKQRRGSEEHLRYFGLYIIPCSAPIVNGPK